MFMALSEEPRAPDSIYLLRTRIRHDARNRSRGVNVMFSIVSRCEISADTVVVITSG
jgi:hypothetical protein